MGMMPKTTRDNVLVAMAPFLVAEGLMCYPVFFNGRPLLDLLAPISLLTVFPAWCLQYALENPSYESCGLLLGLIFFDIIVIWIMVFSISKNHKYIGCISLFVFVFLSIACYANSS
jgi:hypothetical protein